MVIPTRSSSTPTLQNFPTLFEYQRNSKKVDNKRYDKHEIDLNVIFQRLLLLQEKKYAAVKMENATSTSIELKGLDMKRRE